jgi:glycosyltransferase involved in cell wall biosynthesis
VAEKAIAAYGLLDPPRPRRRGPAPLRVALVGPLPPTRSGVAGYNARLASHLAERCELDCIAEGEFERPPTEVPARKYRVFPSRALGAVLGASNYDTILYSLANGRHHDETYELALHYPGIVWLHDVHLADLYLSYALARFESEPSREFMLNTLRHHYRERAREDLMQSDDWTSHAAYEQAGSRLSAELARRSRGAIVGSARALTALELDAGPYAGLPPTWVVPLAVPPVPDRAVTASVDDEPLILTIGRVTPDSQPDLLLEAVATVNRTIPARLAFVGELADGHRKNLMARIEELGLDGRCELTGWVDSDTYESWLRRAVCVVQLRHDVSGASSVAVTDALAHCLPTITSHGASAEFPEGTVRFVSIDAGPAALAEDLRAVLGNDAERERLRAGALAYAKSWTFDDVADRLIEIAQADSIR